MPYAVVESTDAIGKKELFIAPETWIQTDPLKTTYLSWPNVRTISKLRALLADEFSVPSVVWERQECEVICRNIPSLESADKLLDTMQKQCKEQSSISVMDADEMIVSECSSEDESSPQNDPFNAIEENLELTAQEKEEDPLVDMKPFPQLLNLIFELKSLIEYNQQEIGKKLEEGFFRVQRTIISLTEKNHEWIRKDLHLNSVCEHGMERFKINAFKTKEELDVFEQQLNDAEYKKKVQNWIDFAVGHTQTANHRMHELIDLIFDRKLFACFTWYGASGNKEALMDYTNVLSLFEYAANSSVEQVGEVYIEHFLKRKLNHAVGRLKIKPGRRTTPHKTIRAYTKKKKNENADAQQTNRGEQANTKQQSTPKTSVESRKQVEQCEAQPLAAVDVPENEPAESSIPAKGVKGPVSTSTAQQIKEQAKLLIQNYQSSLQKSGPTAAKKPIQAGPSKSLYQKKNSSPQMSILEKPAESSYVPISVSPVKSIAEMDAFEAQLNDSECRKHVHNWINCTVGHMPDNHSRMVELIDRLIDHNLLRNFNWSGTNQGKRPLEEYRNFVELFEYACRKELNRTIIYNHDYVAKYFMCRLN